jgi:hypothetical protein
MKYKKMMKEWIQDIPDSRLEGGMPDGNTVYSDRFMRLDNQRTFKKPDGLYYFNLQVQVNRGCPHTIAMCHAPAKNPWTAAKIKQERLASVTGAPLGR